jgi:hypothetical protein
MGVTWVLEKPTNKTIRRELQYTHMKCVEADTECGSS